MRPPVFVNWLASDEAQQLVMDYHCAFGVQEHHRVD